MTGPAPALDTAPAVVAHGFATRPDGLAVLADGVQVTRAALDRASLDVAWRCVEAGVGAAVPCFSLVPLDADGVVGCLGAVRSGGAVVHVDPALPGPYLRDIAERTGARVAVVTPRSVGLAKELGLVPVVASVADAGAPARSVEGLPSPTAEDPARVRFTSGSTGRPKGVSITHAQDVRSLRRTQTGPAGQRRALLIPFGPTAPRHAVLGAVTEGFVVCPFDVRDHGLEHLIAFLDEQQVAFVRTPVSLFRSLVGALGDRRLTAVRSLTMTGEAIHAGDLRAFAAHVAPGAVLECGYGSSETGRLGTLVVRAGDDLPDGPLVYPPPPGEARVRICRPDGSPAEPGEVGEIVAFGGRVLRGYVDDPALSAARFLVDADGTPGYRTGDLGRLHPGGLEVLGRADDQVTVRGTNVHLGTVEQALRSVPGVADGAVVAASGRAGGTELRAFVVAADRIPPTTAQLRRALAVTLPPSMVPDVFLAVDGLPRLANGKLDRKALEERGAAAVPTGAPYRQPVTSTEVLVARCVARTLALDVVGHRVGRDDDVFDLGCNSLAAVELLAALEAETGVRLDVADLAVDPTVVGLAQRLEGAVRAEAGRWLQFGSEQPGLPLLLFPGKADSALHLRALALRLARPVHVRRSPGIDEPAEPVDSFRRSVQREAAHVRALVPRGPYLLGGHSAGGVLALEVARRLQAEGEEVAALVLLDTSCPSGWWARLRQRAADGAGQDATPSVRALVATAGRGVRNLVRLRFRSWRRAVRGAGRVAPPDPHPLDTHPADPSGARDRIWLEASYARLFYRTRPLRGTVLVARATERFRPRVSGTMADLGWSSVVRGRLEVVDVPGDHTSCIEVPTVDVTAARVAARLGELLGDPAPRAAGARPE